MASIGISESTYAIALLSEIQSTSWGSLAGYPIMPSLVDEGGAGWDAFLPLTATPMFFQFKISDYMFHPNSGHHIFFGQQPYFRFHLHPRDDFAQHGNLRSLAQTFPDTFYVCPEMQSTADFQQAYFHRDVVANSRFVPLLGCHDIVGGHSHEIVFNAMGAWQASDPEKVRSTQGQDFKLLLREVATRSRTVDYEFALQLLHRMSEFVSLPIREGKQETTTRGLLGDVADLAMCLGLHFVLVG